MHGQPSAFDVHPHYLNLLIRKDEVLDPDVDEDGIVLKVDEYPWERDENDLTADAKADPTPQIEGSEGLQRKLKELIEEFSDIFSTELRKEPADLGPMEIEIY